MASFTMAEPGRTPSVSFTVPDDARAISFLATVDDPVHVQLGSVVIGGTDVVQSPDHDVGEMARRFEEFEVLVSPTGIVHEVRRGRSAFTFPNVPGLVLEPGPAEVTFLVDQPTSVDIDVVIVRSEPARLAVDVVVADGGELSDAIREGVESIYRPAGIGIEWRDLDVPGLPSELPELGDGGPGSPMWELTHFDDTRPDGVNLVVMERLPGGLSGYATSVPGAHDGSGAAVVVTFRSATESARLIAHEIGHLLGLRHLEDRSTTGVVVANPIPDTAADGLNLMQFGTNLTPGQIEVLRLSPLLSPTD